MNKVKDYITWLLLILSSIIIALYYLVLKNASFTDCSGVLILGVDGGVQGIDFSSSLRLLPVDGCLLLIGPLTNLSGKREKSAKWEYPPTDWERSRGFGGFNIISRLFKDA